MGDSELWVAMLGEAIKTYPASGALNTEISDLDEVRPIFTDLVNDLRKHVRKQADHVMLPMECHYLNKPALVSVVGQQPAPMKHFTLKKKPKSALLRAELLQKSADAASNVKKASAPVIPVRSRGMPRKMTDSSKPQPALNFETLTRLFSSPKGHPEPGSHVRFSLRPHCQSQQPSAALADFSWQEGRRSQAARYSRPTTRVCGC